MLIRQEHPKECIICLYCWFLNKKIKYQSSVCNGYYDVLIISIDINSNAISNTDGVDYYCIIIGIGN